MSQCGYRGMDCQALRHHWNQMSLNCQVPLNFDAPTKARGQESLGEETQRSLARSDLSALSVDDPLTWVPGTNSS